VLINVSSEDRHSRVLEAVGQLGSPQANFELEGHALSILRL